MNLGGQILQWLAVGTPWGVAFLLGVRVGIVWERHRRTNPARHRGERRGGTTN